ncbi:hypothetical protein KDA_43150 [Dictyobacter alpinus]|uniref:histidine kinase n=1 Tax=Dictyobacter alpinus TaxID=2014873 RepID=A0A402BBM5_9CHLR|nr:HAMP domain-containing sensor histidine kinase [Dictyobacter alpinus]GCE28831.1 hypothetical protein KDA_43150 [Dictyobacter alpinus]
MLSKFYARNLWPQRKHIQWHIYTMGHMPLWRRPLYGYLAGFLLVSIGLLTGLERESWQIPVFLPSAFLNFYIILVAFIWGFGPSLLTLLLGLLVIDWLYVHPYGLIFHNWSIYNISFLATFALSGIIISLIVHQRELARLHAQLNTDKAQEAHRQLEDFIGLVSHELKTPLTATQGNIQLAQRRLRRYIKESEPADQQRLTSVQQVLSIALRQTEVQHRLVDDLLDASRIEGQRLHMIKVPCDLVQIVREAVESQRIIAPMRTIVLEDIPDECVSVVADADRIAQVVNNYLSNALKYAPSDKPISVRIEKQASQARVQVRDEGPGLPEDEQERIWTRFYRVSTIHVQEDSGVPNIGLGVGLHICRAITQQHQGMTGVISRPGAGATFWFTLPLATTALYNK